MMEMLGDAVKQHARWAASAAARSSRFDDVGATARWTRRVAEMAECYAPDVAKAAKQAADEAEEAEEVAYNLALRAVALAEMSRDAVLDGGNYPWGRRS